MRRRAGWLLLIALVAMLSPTRADAHALLIKSDPAAGATLTHSPSQVVITFGEQPDPNLSSIKVLDTSGRTRAGGRPQPVAGQAATLKVAVGALENGVYTVTWQTVSEVDGHLAGGAFAFGIGVAPGPASATSTVGRTPRPSTLAVASRWIFLTGVLGLVGLAFTETVLAPGAPAWPRVRGGLLASWVLAAAGTAGLTQAQRSAAHVPIGSLLASSLGRGLELRGIPVIVAAVLLVAVLARRWPPGVIALGLAGLAAMLGDVSVSHAAARSGWEWFRLATQWVHIASVGVWVGGLAGLLLTIGAVAPDRRRAVAGRFSLIAVVSLMVVLATGMARAVDEIGTWSGLIHTGFGQLIIVKVALLGLLAILGGVNRYRSVSRVGTEATSLRRVGGAELVVVAVVLVATAFLQNLSPPQASATTATKLGPIVLDAHDFATTMKIHLVISPGTPGFNRFRLTAVDYDTGRPVASMGIIVTFHYPDRTDVGDSTLTVARAPDGSYGATGSNVALAGHYQLTVLVQQTQGATDIPFDLVTQSGFGPITTQRNRGLPTFYTAPLAGGDQLQMYVDPGPKLDEFHATFLDASGNEIPVSEVHVASAREPSGSQALLTTRKLDALGHYVSDAQTARGTYRFTVTGTAANGDTLGADIDIPVR